MIIKDLQIYLEIKQGTYILRFWKPNPDESEIDISINFDIKNSFGSF